MIVGEAWGKDEAAQGRPFVGYTGGVLRHMLRQVGIDDREVYMTNVFNFQPQPTNDIKNVCGPRAEGIPGLPYLVRGKYVKARYAGESASLPTSTKLRPKPSFLKSVGPGGRFGLTLVSMTSLCSTTTTLKNP